LRQGLYRGLNEIAREVIDLVLGFVEDRLATLEDVINEPELDQWNLYLGKILFSL